MSQSQLGCLLVNVCCYLLAGPVTGLIIEAAITPHCLICLLNYALCSMGGWKVDKPFNLLALKARALTLLDVITIDRLFDSVKSNV